MRGLYTDPPTSMKFTRSSLGSLCFFIVFAMPASAAESIVAKNAWARATAPGMTNAAVYMDVSSATDASIVGVASQAAASAELHETRVEGGVIKMRPVARVALPARQIVKIAPGGLHIMLVGLKQPLKSGERIPLVLTVDGPGGRQLVTAQAVVRPSTSTAMPDHSH
jgi:periplasmic copper chaperone A